MKPIPAMGLAGAALLLSPACVDQDEPCAEQPAWVYRVDVFDDVDPRSAIAYLSIEINGSGLTDVVRTYTPRGEATTMAFPCVVPGLMVQFGRLELADV